MHYILEQMNFEDKEWVTVNPQVKTCEYVVSNLKPGAYYYFRVYAVNCKGKGEDIKMYQPTQAKDILGLYWNYKRFSENIGVVLKYYIILMVPN